MLFKRKLKCSFCAKSETQVTKLVAGHRGYICDVCAAEAHRIMSQPNATEPTPSTPQSRLLRVRILRLFSRLSRSGTPTPLSRLPA
jgi:ATP-dependent protease Clp ATPase subunit